ncbi:MAG: hypothetical protein EXS15_04555 [Phycisphaerales bacterium]|nr:hypothetical protein [Phycisphaerales bacterium]
MTSKIWRCAIGIGCSALFSATAAADFIDPVVPAWRGSAGADFYGWESFTSAFGGPNLPNYEGTESGAALFNFGAGAFITGAGNLYAGGGPLSISIYGGLTSAVSDIIVNLATMGTIINGGSVRVTLADNAGNFVMLAPTVSSLQSSTEGEGGYIQTRAYRWEIGPLSFEATRFVIDFASQSSSIALNTVSADFRYVPAPGALALLCMAYGLRSHGHRRR